MSLFKQLQAREAEGNPIRVGVIGAGKFGTMFLAQAAKLPGVHIVGVADLSVEGARSSDWINLHKCMLHKSTEN